MSKIYFLIALKHVFLSFAFLSVADYFGVLKHCIELDFIMFHYPMHENALESAHKIRFNLPIDFYPVKPYHDTFIHNPVQKCSKEGIRSPKLVILVKSAIYHFERRSAIRRTWGSETEYVGIVKTVFLLGSSSSEVLEKLVHNENEQFSDIVKKNFFDSYYNNTIKTLMGLQWAVENCDHSPYFMFVDDDYFVSIKNVLTYIGNFLLSHRSGLEKKTLNVIKEKIYFNISKEKYTRDSVLAQFSTRTPKTNLIEMNAEYRSDFKNSKNCLNLFAGFVIKSSPHRHKFSKWYIDLSEYPFDMWPPYVTAGAYILSRESLTELFFMSMVTKIFKYDDIYLGILALKANITVTHCSEFYFEKARYIVPLDYRYVIASHGYGNPKEMVKTWSECRYAGYA